MCLVVDANIFGEFFKDPEFEPAYNWVRNGPGKLITGGSKYKAELGRSRRILNLVVDLGRRGRTVPLSDDDVDRMQRIVESTGGLHSDDPHIIAMVIVSRCKIVCTRDDALQMDFRDRFRHRFGLTRPRVYKKRRDHMPLLCSRNIVRICR